LVRQVFFSFHYGRDIWRVNQVRNSWVVKKDREAAGFVDAAEWEEVKREGEDAIKEWIDDQMHGTSVTAVLIGNETAGRDWRLDPIRDQEKYQERERNCRHQSPLSEGQRGQY